jgi:uncharacterized protein YndB with AHSA1/START domain
MTEAGQYRNRKEMVLSRTIAAPRELVFKAWTDPKQMAQWWGPNMFTVPLIELDVRPGGAIRIDMRGPDGTVYPMSGVFREIAEPERLIFASTAVEDEQGDPQLQTLSTITFTEQGGGTEVKWQERVTKATPKAAGALEGMEEGSRQTLDRLAKFLEKG